MEENIPVSVKENAWIAFIAAKVLRSKSVAIVINRTIYLHNTGYNNFIKNRSWLLHELKHVEQYQRYGVTRFLLLYVYETILNGYKQNRFEVEARDGETGSDIHKKYSLRKRS